MKRMRFAPTLLVLAGSALVLLATGCKSGYHRGPSAPPGRICPDGWKAVTPPQNPALVCLPDRLVTPTTPTPDTSGECPDGWAGDPAASGLGSRVRHSIVLPPSQPAPPLLLAYCPAKAGG